MRWFDWLPGRREHAPHIPATLWRKTLCNYPFLGQLDTEEQSRLKTLAENFLASKEFSSGGDLQLTDEICTAIATQACLPILNLDLTAYDDWIGIVVYPGEFIAPRQLEDEDGVVHEFDDVLSGEAWQGGPVLISWQDVQQAGAGYNVVIHEFAHKLDMRNGEADGIPALHSRLSEKEWISVFDTALENFCQRLDAGEETRIDPYASESPAEFFAVICEVFFETPLTLAEEYPALYTLFCRYFRQDPLTRSTKPTSAARTAAS